MNWIQENAGSIIVIAILALVVFFVIRSMIKRKREGKSCSGCSACAARGTCHQFKEQQEHH